MKETDFQTKLIKQLYSQGAWVFNIHGHRFQKGGVPDLLVIHPRFNGFVELKVEDRKADDSQKKVANDIKKRLFPAFVIRCREYSSDFTSNIFDAAHEITIEDFYGHVICHPAGLDKMLDCLQDLVEKDDLFTKAPKIIIDKFKAAKAGDTVYMLGKIFLCHGDI
jgi:hypothetical protein